jgi:hypothetical protein
MYENDCLCVRHTKSKIRTMLLANLWQKIDLVKGRFKILPFLKVMELDVKFSMGLELPKSEL